MDIFLEFGLPAIGLVVMIFAIIFGAKIYKKIKNGRSVCKKCNAELSQKDLEIIAGGLQWEKKTKTEYKGDYEYEITYKVYYRIVSFDFTCPNCGNKFFFNKRYNLYRSDSNYSQSDEEEYELLKSKIRSTFKEGFFEEDFKIANLDY